MTISSAPVQAPITDKGMSSIWSDWFTKLARALNKPVAFSYSLTADIVLVAATWTQVSCTTKIYDLNNSCPTGTFTVPTNGLYYLNFAVDMGGGAASDIVAKIFNGADTLRRVRFKIDTTPDPSTVSVNAIANLLKGDIITAHVHSSVISTVKDDTTYFEVYKLPGVV